MRFQREIALNPAKDVKFCVTGQLSGVHYGETILSSDSRTVIFKPSLNFESGEQVTVDITTTEHQNDFSFSFRISPTNLNGQIYPEHDVTENQTTINKEVSIIKGVSVPDDFPIFKPSINKQTDDGLLFISTDKFLMIL